MKKSKIGIILASIYLIITIIIWIYTLFCSGMYCGLILVLPTTPWSFLLEGIINDSIFVFLVLVAFNSVLVYYLGWLIDRLIKKLKFFH